MTTEHSDPDPRGAGLVGMPLVAAGMIVFALAVSSYVSVGALVPILLVAGVGALVAARDMTRQGRRALAGVYGAFAGFWLTYAGVVLGLTHDWYGISTNDSTSALLVFLTGWLTVMVIMTVSVLDQPRLYLVMLGLFDLALALLLGGTITGTPALFTAAGAALFACTALAVYLAVVDTAPTRLRRALTLGSPLLTSPDRGQRSTAVGEHRHPGEPTELASEAALDSEANPDGEEDQVKPRSSPAATA